MASGGKLDEIQEDFLTCKICLEPYTKPKALECLHTFCLHCIEGYSQKQTKDGMLHESSLSCPVCRSPTKIPAGGFHLLKSNFLIESLQDVVKTQTSDTTPKCDNCFKNDTVKRCFDCNENLCTTCTDAHKLVRLTSRHKLVDLAELKAGKHSQEFQASQKLRCSFHEEDFLKFFCQNCKIPICINCKVLDHDNHQCIPLSAASAEQLPKFKDGLEKLTSFIETTKISLDKLKEMKATLADSKSEIDQSIRNSKQQLLAQIDQLEKGLLDKNEQNFLSENKKLEAETDFFEITLASLESTKQLCEQLVSHGNDVQILSMVKDMENQLEKINSAPLSKSIEQGKASFSKNSHLQTDSSLLGSVSIKRVEQVLAPPNKYQAAYMCQTCKVVLNEAYVCYDTCDYTTNQIDPNQTTCPQCGKPILCKKCWGYTCQRCRVLYNAAYTCNNWPCAASTKPRIVYPNQTSCMCGQQILCRNCSNRYI